MYVWWFSPQMNNVVCLFCFVQHVGEIHRRGDVFLYIRSPLFLFYYFVLVYLFVFVYMSGRLHRVELYIRYSRSPLSEPEYTDYVSRFSYSDDGEIHRSEEKFVTLVLPPMKQFMCIFDGIWKGAFLVYFKLINFKCTSASWQMIHNDRGSNHPILCIYIV